MSHVSVHYKIIIPAGHHRQPRNPGGELEPDPSSEVDVNNPGNITPLYIPQIPYAINNQAGLAQMLFWSVTDGTNGQTAPAGPLTQPVGANPLTITAWYYPISGPGLGGGGSAIIDDAFSAAKGDFIDDTFVTVAGDPALTEQANVVGVVPTNTAETLQAYAAATSTTEPFSKWISFGAGMANGNTLNVPAQANGIAIAIYEAGARVPLNPKNPAAGEAIYGTIIGGVAVDGGGAIVINGVPHPVDPWGPAMIGLVNASLATAGSRAMDRNIGAQVRQLAAKSVLQAIKAAMPNIEKEAGG